MDQNRDEKALTYKDIETLTSQIEALQKNQAKPPKKKVEKPLLYEGFLKKSSLNITEDLPLKKVLPELTKQAGINLQMDPKIEDKIYFHSQDERLIDIIEQLCELANLRYVISGKNIRIEKDTPYSKNYNVQFLNLTRSTQNKVSIATDVFSSSKKIAYQQGDNGSNSTVSMTNESDFWKELEVNLYTLVGGKDKESGNFSIHKQGGIITVNGTEKLHRKIKGYLEDLRKTVSTQVLIEAKIVEVTLSDQYRSGINWQKLTNPGDFRVNAPFGNLSQGFGALNPGEAQGTLITLGMAGRDFTSILAAVETFGASKILSSPRLTVLNNQTAILKVAKNEVYFKLNYNKQYNVNIDRESYNVSSDIQTVPIGLIMTVQPSIDEETGEIILSLRPTISKLSRTVRDPAVDIAFNSLQTNVVSDIPLTPSLVPVVEVREMDSVIRLRSGEMGVMGGLMEVRSLEGRTQLPGIGDIPLIGELTKSRADGDEVVELVIILKATIVDQAPLPDEADNRLYYGYMKDPRSFEAAAAA